ncbi:MAG: hypothetical protein ABI597_11965 [Gammaproteobacteria bacterium]
MQDIFEIAIYSKIWVKIGDVADSNMCMNFITQFIEEKNIQMIQKEAVAEIAPTPNHILIYVANLHCELVLPAGNVFVRVTNKGFIESSKIDMYDPIGFVVRIDTSHLDKDKIREAYVSYKQEIAKILADIYLGGDDLAKWILPPVKVLYQFAPDLFKEKLEKILIAIKTNNKQPWLEIEEVLQVFSGHKEILKIILANADIFLADGSDLLRTARIFPEEKDTIAEYLVKNPEKYLLGFWDITPFSDQFPEKKSNIDSYFLNILSRNPEKLLTNWFSIQVGLTQFPDQREKMASYIMQNNAKPRSFFKF